MDGTLTLEANERFSLSAGQDGKTVIKVPLPVLIRAYCDYVASQVNRSTTWPEGAKVQ